MVGEKETILEALYIVSRLGHLCSYFFFFLSFLFLEEVQFVQVLSITLDLTGLLKLTLGLIGLLYLNRRALVIDFWPISCAVVMFIPGL